MAVAAALANNGLLLAKVVYNRAQAYIPDLRSATAALAVAAVFYVLIGVKSDRDRSVNTG